MSFETIATISAITEAIVLLGIVLTLSNAFMDGKLAASFGKHRRAAAAPSPPHPASVEDAVRRAA